MTIVSRTCLIAADLLVMIVTWRATRSARGLSGVERWSFAKTLLRNGEGSPTSVANHIADYGAKGTVYFL